MDSFDGSGFGDADGVLVANVGDCVGFSTYDGIDIFSSVSIRSMGEMLGFYFVHRLHNRSVLTFVGGG